MSELNIVDVDILDETKDCFLTYAEEVLTDRAIPAAEDGLLSSQRKILWTMNSVLGMDATGKTKKCASIVGSTLSSSYIHGDASCYGVLTKMSQPFLMRYPLVIGQGALGTQEENGMVSSPRYTEAKPSEYADMMFYDFKKNVVPLIPTYNNEYIEPVVLPAAFPNALCNGREAIGIAMAHNSLPHNLTEICNAIMAYIKADGQMTIDEFMEYVPAPDFPLGGTIMNSSVIKEAYATGKSKVSLVVRGDYIIEDNKIIFTTIPYRTYRKKIKEDVNKNIEIFENYIKDFNDESSLGQNRLVFELLPNVNVEEVLNQLFALTDLQTTLSMNMTFIVNGTPKLCSMLDLVESYANHQETVLIARTKYNKEKAEDRAEILNGLLKAIDAIDAIIAIIRNSESTQEAKAKIMELIGTNERQTKAILDMPLKSLTKLDSLKLKSELETKEIIIAKCEDLLTNKSSRNKELVQMLEGIKKRFGDERKTKIEDTYVKPTAKSAQKALPAYVAIKDEETLNTYNTVSRGTVKVTDDIFIFSFTNLGRVYKTLISKFESNKLNQSITAKAKLKEGEQIIISLIEPNEAEKYYVTHETSLGRVLTASLSEYIESRRCGGSTSVKMKKDETLVKVTFSANIKEGTLIKAKGSAPK